MDQLAIALGLFVGSLVLCVVTTAAIRALATRRRVGPEIDVSGAGGVAVFVAWALPLALLGLLAGERWSVLFGDRHVVGGIALSVSLMFLLGLYEDFRAANAGLRLIVQTMIALALYALGIRIDTVSNPFGEPFVLGLFSPVLTVCWVIGITHAVNLMNGIDGLAAGVCAMTAVVMAIASRSVGSSAGILYAVPLAGAGAGFLVYSFPPARVRMGASGTFFLGSVLAIVSLLSSQKGHVAVAVFVPVVAFGLPLTNASLALIRRFLCGRGLFEADGRHVYHRLLDLGLSPRRVVLALYVVTLAFGMASLLLVNASSLRATLIVCAVLGIIVVACSRLGYHEFRHIWDFVERGMGHRGELIFARQIVSLAGQRIAEANRFDDIWYQTRMVARLLLFDRVTLEPADREMADSASATDGNGRSALSRRVWAKDHASEDAPAGDSADVAIWSNGRRLGTIIFERLRHRINTGDHAALADLGEYVSARVAGLERDTAGNDAARPCSPDRAATD